MKVAIIDYGMGNVRSIASVLKYLCVDDIKITRRQDDLIMADKLIMPGVGSFKSAMKRIIDLNLDQYLKNEIIANKKPVLGICLGMQIMGISSTENGFSYGLGYVDAKTKKIESASLKVPHMGFDQVESCSESKLFKGIDNLSDFYFVHSFQMSSRKNIKQSLCKYERNFIASYEVENIAGVQFHPELSQTNGIKLIRNYLEKF